jgi:hypothetical protein
MGTQEPVQRPVLDADVPDQPAKAAVRAAATATRGAVVVPAAAMRALAVVEAAHLRVGDTSAGRPRG